MLALDQGNVILGVAIDQGSAEDPLESKVVMPCGKKGIVNISCL